MSTPTDPNRLWTLFAFLPGSVDLVTLVDLLASRPLGFEAVTSRLRVIGSAADDTTYTDGFWDEVRATPDASGFELSGARESQDAERCTLNVTVARAAVEVLLGGVEPDPGLVAALVSLPGLIGGSRGDHVDARWQGESHPPHYEFYYDGPWEHLPRVIDDRGRERIDVSGNPGRINDVPGWRMWAAQDDWFGPGARLYVDLDAVRSLPVGTVADLGPDRWHVRLWEDGAPLDEVRVAQQALRDHLGYDAAVERADDIFDELTAGQPDDPMFVAQEGVFAHGGVTRVLQYFSTEKRPTTRSRAAWLEILEFDPGHQEVHSEVVDLTQHPHP